MALGNLVSVLETHRGRDRVVRLLCYGCQLAGGALVARSGAAGSSGGRRLLRVSGQLSHSRTVLRLFDDPAMLACSCQYGLGPKEEDTVVRWLSVLSNLVDQLYYPCEHVAWAADAEILPVRSARWWALSTALWAASLLLGIARSLRILAQLRKKLETQHRDSVPKIRVRAKAELLTVLGNLADLSNAVHWLPTGVLWAGRCPLWLVGLMGTISSLLGIYQTYGGGGT